MSLFSKFLGWIASKIYRTGQLDLKRLWIVSADRPIDIAEKLGLTNIQSDLEGYWEWVIGTDKQSGHRINI